MPGHAWHGRATDPLWVTIADACAVRPTDVAWVFWCLLDYASQQHGSIAGFPIEHAAAFSRLATETVARILAAFVAHGLVADWQVTDWHEEHDRPRAASERAARTRVITQARTQAETHNEPVTKRKRAAKQKDAASEPASQQRAKRSDPLFVALVESCYERPYGSIQLTDSERGRFNRAAAELRKLGATPEDVRARAQVYRQRFPGRVLTPNALVANWNVCYPNGREGTHAAFGQRTRTDHAAHRGGAGTVPGHSGRAAVDYDRYARAVEDDDPWAE